MLLSAFNGLTAGSLAIDLANGLQTGLYNTLELLMFQTALESAGVQDPDLFGAIEAHNDIFVNDSKAQEKMRDVISQLLKQPNRNSYWRKALPHLGPKNLFLSDQSLKPPSTEVVILGSQTLEREVAPTVISGGHFYAQTIELETGTAEKVSSTPSPPVSIPSPFRLRHLSPVKLLAEYLEDSFVNRLLRSGDDREHLKQKIAAYVNELASSTAGRIFLSCFRNRPETPGLLSPGMNGRPERASESWRSGGIFGIVCRC